MIDCICFYLYLFINFDFFKHILDILIYEYLYIFKVFHQGDEGRSWYIILRGSVDVVIHGKGTVTTLQECDDFGKLALINDAPR